MRLGPRGTNVASAVVTEPLFDTVHVIKYIDLYTHSVHREMLGSNDRPLERKTGGDDTRLHVYTSENDQV